MIEQILILFIVALISIYITYPYFYGYRYKRSFDRIIEKELEINRLENLKQLYIDEIKDIEFDYSTGKLNDSDYSELLRKYKLKAANVLEAIDKSDYKNIKEVFRKGSKTRINHTNIVIPVGTTRVILNLFQNLFFHVSIDAEINSA